jgi:hypothetical protein
MLTPLQSKPAGQRCIRDQPDKGSGHRAPIVRFHK